MPSIVRRQVIAACAATAMSSLWPARTTAQAAAMRSWPLGTPRRTGIHDLAPAPDGGVWFTAQASGHLGWFDPRTGKTELVALGSGSAPHGVIPGPDKAAWVNDGGLGAIVRVGWPDRSVRAFALPPGAPYANLNTATFDAEGDLWFTGQSGVVGKLVRKTGVVTVKDAPKGRGPYGICTTPGGDVWWCSLAGSFIARIDRRTGESTVVEPPTKDQGARRIWSDSRGHLWVSDFGGNAVFRFDPVSEHFERFGFPREAASVRQIHGRPGEVWLPESGTEFISVIQSAT